ncbi:AAA family ATPase [Devosia sp. LjRoot3]|uniref:AAA family ATPase n=1 Tax=Devosia sp. LjRoot3 TaxID=3342319 RepID=UPI003ED01859
MANIEDEVPRRMMKRLYPANRKHDAEVSVQILVAEQALKNVLSVDLRKAWSGGGGGATAVLVPSSEWVPHIATAVEDICGELCVHMKVDGKKRDEHGSAIARALGQGKGVVAISPSPDFLPKMFHTVVDHTLQIAVTPATIAAVVRTVAIGRLPRSFSELNLGLLDFDEICGLIVPGNSASDIHGRFERAIAGKRSLARNGENLPNMEEAIEFGQAQRWALDLKQDLSDFLAGKIGIEEVDKGIILHGPPGTGKTLFARSLGQYLGIPVIVSSMAEFFASSAGYLDSVVKAQRDLFEKARQQKPCLIFLDELDATPDLDKIDRNTSWWSPVVNDFLALLDGATSDRSGVIVIGATNRLHAISPALRRPGRFEREVFLGLPDSLGTLRVLRHHLADQLADKDLTEIVDRCTARSMSPAVIMEKVRSAKRISRRAKRDMTLDDLRASIVPVDERDHWERFRVASHEAGHALLAALYCPELLVSVDIEQDGGSSGGSTHFRPLRTAALTRESLIKQVKVLLGGRGAETLMMREPSAGSGGGLQSDLHQATSLLAMAAMSFGLDARVRWRCTPEQAVDSLLIDPELRLQIEDDLESLAVEVEVELRKHRPALEALVKTLMNERRLNADRVLHILSEYKPGSVRAVNH